MKERTRGEQGEDKKLTRMLTDLDEMFGVLGKTVGEDVLSASSSVSAGSIDSKSKSTLKTYVAKLREAKEDLEHMHKVNEEERERMSARRSLIKRTGSVEADAGGNDSPRGARGGSSGRDRGGPPPTSSGGRRLFRKTVSVGDTIAETDALWKSHDSTGSQESLASNASIPLPIPVRTRSAHGGGGNDDSYNAMSIRRLERDTSVDRLSTGSRESNMSTQSEWVAGEKKKKAGLIGKLKKLTRKSEDKEFGSGSDISAVSVASSSMSAFQKAQQKRAASKERTTRAKTPQEANEPFDKYFGNGSQAKGVPSRLTGNSSTLPRQTTYRRF